MRSIGVILSHRGNNLMDDEFTICIVGLGLMGGSLALALKQAGWARHIVGVSRSRTTLAAARDGGAIDVGTSDLAEGIAAADVVVLATPVRTILQLLPQVGRHAAAGALILDLGSSKTQICAALAELPAHLEPMGGHPMCGKEVAGFAAADASLFQRRPFVLCPLPRTAPAALRLADSLARATGAHPVVLTPGEHDRAVAAISHLPYTVAVALVNTVGATGNPLAWSLASSGFRDTSRVAGSDVDMMLDTLLTNREAVLTWIEAFAAQLDGLRDALATGDEPALRAQLTAARAKRVQVGKTIG